MIYSDSDLSKINSRKIYFDANILIYLFFSTGQYNSENKYGKLFKNLRKLNFNVVVDVIAISEFVNVAFKYYFNEYKIFHNGIKFKEFRGCQEGIKSAKEINVIVNEKILKYFELINSSYSKQELTDCLEMYTLDFNDKLIYKSCINNNFVLLTDDKDFVNYDLDILTLNSKIIGK